MDLTVAEKALRASPDHRVLRIVPDPETWGLAADHKDTRRGLIVDVETTGLDQDVDEVIEIAMIPFSYERDTGHVVEVHLAHAISAFRQPTFPIPPASTSVHGISDADVAGATIDEAQITRLLADSQIVIAHNAAFDRPMVEKHWPSFAQMHWACSLTDIDWAKEGISSGKLDYILFRQGWFHNGHRARDDALATLFLLHRPLPKSAGTGLQALLENARKPLHAVRAESTPFEMREALKQRGYKWDAGAEREREKAWWILTEDPETEIAWLRSEIYGDMREISVIPMPATRRYSTRIWSLR